MKRVYTPRLLHWLLSWLLAPVVVVATLQPAYCQDDTLTVARVGERIERAEAARRQAAAQDAEWLETADLINRARQALAGGELQRATELADAATAQAELALEQAGREAVAWQSRVVR